MTREAATKMREALALALSERDPALAEHGDQVAALAMLVGARLGLDDEQLRLVRQAALLHDVGKLAMSREILDKSGPLEPLEWDVIHSHTVIGAQMIDAAPGLADVAALVRSSHERFDGRGYPDGLAGEQIPLGSRIIFACDAYDAMVGGRPYRSAVSSELALTELRRCAGTQFDPLVIETLCEDIIGGWPTPASDSRSFRPRASLTSSR